MGLGVSQDRVKYFRYSPTGGLDALCYWRDGHSGEQFPTSWKFLLDTIAERQGTTVADKIRKVFFPNQAMTGVKRSIDPLSIPLVAEASQISGHSKGNFFSHTYVPYCVVCYVELWISEHMVLCLLWNHS